MTPPLDMLTREHEHPKTRALGHKLIIDNFAGAGGASEGIRLALGRDPDYAINHSVGALVMHRANHPGTVHLCEDVFHVDPRSVVGPDGRVGLAWFSPDCTHFSAARGSKPVSHRVRGLAWVVIRWVKKLDPEQRPEVICLENVREFLTWGPLVLKRDSRGRVMRDSKGRELQIPDPKRAGMTFKRWKTTLERYGYKVEYRILDAADYGAPTHRKRLFLIARRDGKPIVWPEKTHGVGADPRVRPGRDLFKADTQVRPYRTAAECIDWSLPCPSIFLTKREARVAAKQLGLGGLKRPLAKNTMRRIANGVMRYIMRAGKPFIVPTGYGERAGQEPRTHDSEAPLPTVVGEQKHAIVSPVLVQVNHADPSTGSGRAAGRAQDLEKPLPTVTGKHGFGVAAAFMVKNNHGEKPHYAIDEPARTIVGGGTHHAQVVAFLAKHFGGPRPQQAASIERPLPATLAKGAQNQIVEAKLEKADVRKGRGVHGKILGAAAGAGAEKQPGMVAGLREDGIHPVGELPGIGVRQPALQDAQGSGEGHANADFLMKLRGTCKDGQSVDQPAPTISAQGQHVAEVRAFLVKYYGTGGAKSVHEPIDTITAKERMGLVTIEGEDWQIVDIGMRMLTPRELARCQGFDDSYVFTDKTKSEQVARIGNSVPPPIAAAIVRANYSEIA